MHMFVYVLYMTAGLRRLFDNGMSDVKLLDILKYSSDELRRFGENITVPPPRYVRKRLFKCRIWSRRAKYTPAVSGDCVVPRTVR